MTWLKGPMLGLALLALAGCAAIGTITAKRVTYQGSSFIVMLYGEIGQLYADLDAAPDKINAMHVYQVLPDGRYRHLGGYFASDSSGGIGRTGVYSEADRALVDAVLGASSASDFITFDGRNPQNIEEAVRAVMLTEPVLVESPGRLQFPPSPIASSATTAGTSTPTRSSIGGSEPAAGGD